MTQENKESLALGSVLNADTWADFVSRLHHDCVGDGVDWHSTANAIFTVQARRIVAGIDRDYCDQLLVYCEDRQWFSPEDYWRSLDQAERENLDLLCNVAESRPFLECDPMDQWAMLETLPEHHVVAWDEKWEFVNAHFTKDAAEAFIRRKKHDYPDGIRIYVESQHYAWEFKTIIQGILDGQIAFVEKNTGA